MDRRLTFLLLCAYFVVGVNILGFLEGWNDLAIYDFSFVAVPALFFLGLIMIVLAISDSVTKIQVVDWRYFSRCLIYRILSVVVIVAFAVNQNQVLSNKTYPPDATDGPPLVFISYFFGIIFLALSLNGAISCHVISGLISSRNNKTFSDTDLSLINASQFFAGLDIIGSVYLSIKEVRSYPKERLAWFNNLVARNQWPIPGFFGVALGIAAIWTLITLNNISSYVMHGYYILDIWQKNLSITDLQYLLSIRFFLFLFVSVIWALLDIMQYYRKLPTSEMNFFFRVKAIFYAVMSLLLEAALFYFLVRIISSCIEYFPKIDMGEKFNTRFALGYGVYIFLPVTAIILVHLSMILYTRLLVKLCVKNQTITDEDSTRYMRLSLIPVAQIVAMIRLMRTMPKIPAPDQP